MLPKEEKLRRSSEIREVRRLRQHEGHTPLLYLVAKENKLPHSRYAVVISKIFGDACKRNKIRRRIFNAVKEIKNDVWVGMDIIILPKTVIKNADVMGIKESIREIFRKRKLVENEKDI